MTTFKWQTRAIQAGVTASALGALMMMTGCGAMNMALSGADTGQAIAGSAVQGSVHGGNNPVVGATIQLYAVGTAGYGSAATPLLTKTVTTGPGGSFSFTTSDWTCNSGTYVYLTSTGGNPGLTGATNGGSAATPNNASAAFMAALGKCDNLTSSTSIFLNEVTTVAAVFALQQFISIVPNVSLATQPGTAAGVTPAVAPAFSIGSSSGNVQGLQNAFEVAAVLADSSTGVTPGALPAYTGPGAATTRAVTVETWHINTIADILASCINTDTAVGNSDYSATCSNLAQSVTPSTTSLPVDTLQIAYSMTANPSYNVQNTFAFVPAIGAPFNPSDQAVADWSLAYRVAYSYNTAGSTFPLVLNTNEGIAFDSYGNAWVANTGHGSSNVPTFVTELDPAGNFVSTYNSYVAPSGSTTNFGVAIGTNFTQPLTIDPSNNVWTEDTANSALVRIAATSGPGAASTGTNYGISTGSATQSGTATLASDGTGNIYLSLGGPASGSAYNAAFGTANDKGLAVLVPSITGGVLTAGAGSSVQPLGNNVNKGIAVTNYNSGSKYGGLVYVSTTVGVCSSSNGSIDTFFGEAQTIGTTTTTTGSPTPIGAVVNSVGSYKASGCTTATPVTPTTAAQTYQGTTYPTIPAMDVITGLGVDSSDNLWAVNDASVVASGFPEFWISEMVPTYTADPTSGALSASYTANIYTAPFLSGTSNGATLTFQPGTANTVQVDGNSNVWIASSAGTGTFAAVSQTGTFLNPTTPFSAALTNGVSTDNWVCSGFCGGLTYANYAARRGQNGGFAGFAIDLAGNVWAGQSSTGADNVTIIVGVAAPPVLPLSLAAKNGTLGTRP
jgi:hypothetical protein